MNSCSFPGPAMLCVWPGMGSLEKPVCTASVLPLLLVTIKGLGGGAGGVAGVVGLLKEWKDQTLQRMTKIWENWQDPGLTWRGSWDNSEGPWAVGPEGKQTPSRKTSHRYRRSWWEPSTFAVVRIWWPGPRGCRLSWKFLRGTSSPSSLP